MLEGDKSLSKLLQAISAPPRLAIIRAIGQGEACVCHLEAVFPDWRQAFISQHLMALRKANVLVSRREGRYVFYRLQDVETLDIIDLAAKVAGVDLNKIAENEACDCPSCQSIDKSEIQVLSDSI